MATAQSYMMSNGTLVPVTSYAGPVPSVRYMEGGIELVLGGVAVLDSSNVDYIDQLWSYFIGAIEATVKNGYSEFYYPDQPIRVTVKRLGGALLEVVATDASGPKRGVEQMKPALLSILGGATTFFEKIAAVDKRLSGESKNELSRISGILRVL